MQDFRVLFIFICIFQTQASFARDDLIMVDAVYPCSSGDNSFAANLSAKTKPVKNSSDVLTSKTPISQGGEVAPRTFDHGVFFSTKSGKSLARALKKSFRKTKIFTKTNLSKNAQVNRAMAIKTIQTGVYKHTQQQIDHPPSRPENNAFGLIVEPLIVGDAKDSNRFILRIHARVIGASGRLHQSHEEEYSLALGKSCLKKVKKWKSKCSKGHDTPDCLESVISGLEPKIYSFGAVIEQKTDNELQGPRRRKKSPGPRGIPRGTGTPIDI